MQSIAGQFLQLFQPFPCHETSQVFYQLSVSALRILLQSHQLKLGSLNLVAFGRLLLRENLIYFLFLVFLLTYIGHKSRNVIFIFKQWSPFFYSDESTWFSIRWEFYFHCSFLTSIPQVIEYLYSLFVNNR